MNTDHNEAMRLADSVHEMNNAAYMTAIANLNEKNRQQAERIAELEKMQDESSDVEASLRSQIAVTTAACTCSLSAAASLPNLRQPGNKSGKPPNPKVKRPACGSA